MGVAGQRKKSLDVYDLPHAEHPALISRAVKSARDEHTCGATSKDSVLGT